jgi:acyl carrier protein
MFEKIRSIIASQFELDEETITPDTNIIDDIGADSLDVVELITTLEEEFGIIAGDDDISGLVTVHQIVEFVESHS